MHELESVYQERGILQKAEKYFLKSLEMEKLFHSENSPRAAVTLLQLGSVYYERGDLQEAEKLVLQALEMYRLFYADAWLFTHC